MKSADVVVVGAGVAGCTTAYFLSKEGVRVTVVEQDAVGSHASGFAFGNLNYYWIYYWTSQLGVNVLNKFLAAALESYRLHSTLFQELFESTGIDTYYQEGIELNLAFTDDEMNRIREDVEWQKKGGLKSELIDGDEVHRIEPRISNEVIGAGVMNDVAAVDAYRYVLSLIQAAEKMGATQRQGKIVDIKQNGSKPSSVILESGEISCDTVVIAMGPWSGLASQWLDFPVPVEPVRGQILRLQFDQAPLACPMSYMDGYAAKEVGLASKPADDLVWCGTTFERVGFDESATPEAMTSIMKGAVRVVPALEDARLALQTACLRPFSSDELPILGRVPGWDGVYMATAAGAEGILMSPFFGRAITDLIVRGETKEDISPFSPSRFAPEG